MSGLRYAFVFPGQGSQYVGMGKDIAENSEMLSKFFADADVTLEFPIRHIMFEGPEEDLRNTAHAQPAIFLHEIALLKGLEELNIKPIITAGHSVGEYAALVAAGVLDYGHALWLIKQRGYLMANAGKASPGSMMAVIGLDDEKVEEICEKVNGTVSVANYNSPGQVVISGEQIALDEAAVLLKEAGAKRCLPLAVSGAFHSALIEEASNLLKENMDRVIFRDARLPIVTNVDAQAHQDGKQIRLNLEAQMRSSVRWTQTIRRIAEEKPDFIIEVGPGSVLSGLIKRIDPTLKTIQVSTWKDLEALKPENNYK